MILSKLVTLIKLQIQHKRNNDQELGNELFSNNRVYNQFRTNLFQKIYIERKLSWPFPCHFNIVNRP